MMSGLEDLWLGRRINANIDDYSQRSREHDNTDNTDRKWNKLLQQMSKRSNAKRPVCVVAPTPRQPPVVEDDDENGDLFQGIPDSDMVNMDPEDAAVYGFVGDNNDANHITHNVVMVNDDAHSNSNSEDERYERETDVDEASSERGTDNETHSRSESETDEDVSEMSGTETGVEERNILSLDENLNQIIRQMEEHDERQPERRLSERGTDNETHSRSESETEGEVSELSGTETGVDERINLRIDENLNQIRRQVEEHDGRQPDPRLPDNMENRHTQQNQPVNIPQQRANENVYDHRRLMLNQCLERNIGQAFEYLGGEEQRQTNQDDSDDENRYEWSELLNYYNRWIDRRQRRRRRQRRMRDPY